MRRIKRLIRLGGLCWAALTAPALAHAPPPPEPGWTVMFSDSFEGTALDPSKWGAYEDCWGGGNQERECYTALPSNVSVHDGVLDLTARFERASGPSLPKDLRTPGVEPPTATKPFTSGKVSTQGRFAFTYGRVEVRAKAPAGQGLWPGLWLLPQQPVYGPWPGSGEIDLMEGVNLGAKCASCLGGVENNIYGSLHFGSSMHQQDLQKAHPLKKGTESDWHTYRVDWSPDEMVWAVDDQIYYRVKLSNWRDTLQKGVTPAPSVHNAPFDRPFYLIFNLAVGGLWPESHDQGGVVLEGFPKSLLIDWVRISKCNGAVDRAGRCAAQ